MSITCSYDVWESTLEYKIKNNINFYFVSNDRTYGYNPNYGCFVYDPAGILTAEIVNGMNVVHRRRVYDYETNTVEYL